jgi:DNA-binding IscR family transcriptional regulator
VLEQRGPDGGFSLARQATDISLAEIVSVLSTLCRCSLLRLLDTLRQCVDRAALAGGGAAIGEDPVRD